MNMIFQLITNSNGDEYMFVSPSESELEEGTYQRYFL
jgi:hypothetical protein